MTCKDKSVNYFKQVFINTLVLIVLIICIQISDRFVPIFQRGFFCDDESIRYPHKEDTISEDVLHHVGIFLPLITILLMEWWHLRKDVTEVFVCGLGIPTWLRAVFSTQLAYGIGLSFVEITATITKRTIGRLRPHFFDVCKPSVDCTEAKWQNRYIDVQDYSCTEGSPGQLKNIRKSFLSGHSIWASYCMIYTILYLERRKICGSYFARHCIQFALLMMSVFTALSRISDNKHHWSDVLAGYSVGVIIAAVMALWCTELIEKNIRPSPNQQLNEVTTK